MGEPLGVEGGPVALPQQVRLLLDDVEQPVPGEICCDAVGFVEHDAHLVERFGDLVFDTVITRTVRFPETSVAGEPITTWAPRSTGAIAYRALGREFIDRFGA